MSHQAEHRRSGQVAQAEVDVADHVVILSHRLQH